MRKHLIKYAAVGGALAAPLIAMAPASATTAGGSSAFGLSATGLLSVPPTPSVSSTSAPHEKSLVSLPHNRLVQLSVLRARAKGDRAEASVVDLRIAQAAILKTAVLSAKLITSKCDSVAGSSKLVDVKLDGHSIQAGTSPNSTLTVPVQGVGGVRVTINKQVHNANGSLTVTGLELAVQALGKTQVIDIASATCAANGHMPPTSPPSTPPSSPDNPQSPPSEAPTPTPVNSDLPVTG
ncbi:choice-of-anchor P family protein [Actinoallomurus sp. NBC_01490]|jgi:hypothetical protein|uniref:choice-of-anchor P family protein n=1 Tax=Actinoallomurus sp. NBC_01490 TaxID=2903557 RepID=UPI002E30CCA2|nr:choice-of-anchor P family protein [Actinoallomurus sp. NBC_01490]